MRMKVLTTGFFLFGLLMMLGWPFFLGQRPGDGATKEELANFGMRGLIYFGVTAGAFLISAILAIRLARLTRQRYADEAKDNLKELVEGSLRDHGRDKR